MDALSRCLAGALQFSMDHPTVPPHAVKYVLIKKAAELTGYTTRAIEAKIAKGQWVEGREWVKAPDGHRMISLAGYAAWVERGGR